LITLALLAGLWQESYILTPNTLVTKLKCKGKAWSFADFCSGEMQGSQTMKQETLAESYIRRAGNKLNEAKDQLKKFNYAESVSASQESTEFSVKALFLSLDVPFPPKHRIKEMKFKEAVQKLTPDEANSYNFPKVLLMARFWSEFYEVAKYGFEELGVGPDKLFAKAEAQVAIEHAGECYRASQYIYTRRRFGGVTG